MAATVLKIPFEQGILNKEKRGASLAPDVIQKLLRANYKDVKVYDDFEITQKSICSAAEKEYADENFVIGLGGDHSIAYGLMKAFSKKFNKRALVFIDAHLDAIDDFLPPSHEDIIKAAINEGFFEDILIIGARSWEPEEEEFIKKHKIKLGSFVDIPDFIKGKNVYVSLDIDAVDPEEAPGTGWPIPNGLKSEDVLEALKLLKSSGRVKGLDLSEVSPPNDVDNKTAKLAARFLTVFVF